MKKIVLILILIISSCTKEKHKHNFYFSKEKLEFNEDENNALKNTDKLYLHYFDVDNKHNKLEFTKSIKGTIHFDKQVVPVIKIKNKVFFFISSEKVKILAQKINDKIQEKTNEIGLKNYDELQIDCNWTVGSVMNYFLFLEELQKITSKKVSVVIKLHHVKLSKRTGVPPVKKVYLTCYTNYSTFGKKDHKQILDVDLLQNFLQDLETYPIRKIDIILPIHSCGFVEDTRGNNKMIQKLNPTDLENSNFEKINDSIYKVVNEGIYFDYFFNKNLKIRIKKASTENLNKVIDVIDDKLKQYQIIYNDLSSENIKNIDN